MDKPVLPFPLYKRLFIFILFLMAVAVIGGIWGASPILRQRAPIFGRRVARYFGM